MTRVAAALLVAIAACSQPAGTPAQPVKPQPSNPLPRPAPLGFVLNGVPEQGGLLRGTAPGGTRQLMLGDKAVSLGPDGAFLIGLDRDAPAEATLVATLPDGREVKQALSVRPRSWRIEHVDAALRPSGSSEAFLRIRRAELARIAAARARDSAVDGWRQSFVWPAKGRISGRFGSQRVYRGEPGSYHSGTDVAAGAGAPVVAPADGVVVLASPGFSLEGNLVIVDHGMGLNSAFLHLARIDVREGQRLRQGDPVGAVGASGRATGPHLHWGMMWRGARLDPERAAVG